MSEQSPEMISVEITMVGMVGADRLDQLVDVMRRISVVPLALRATAGGEQLMMLGVEDPSIVTIQQFRDHYIQNLDQGGVTSSLPTKVFSEVVNNVDPESVRRTKDDVPYAVSREAFDALLEKCKFKGPITGEKTRKLLFGVARTLPVIEAE